MFNRARDILKLNLPLLPASISLIAILLSQFPPLYSFFLKPNIKIELGTSATIFDNWGNMVFQPYMFIHNSGEKSAMVKSVEIFIIKENASEHIGKLPVQTFFQKVQIISSNVEAPQIPVRLIHLKPGEVWANYVSAWKVVDENRKDRISKLMSEVETYFDKNYVKDELLTLSNDLYQEAKDITIKEQHKILAGKYFVLISALDTNEKIMNTEIYTFILRESQVKKFTDKLEEYKYGGGIIFPLNKNKFFGTTVSLYKFKDNTKKNELIQKYLIKNSI